MVIDEAWIVAELLETVAELQSQVNSKIANFMEARERPKAMNGDKKHLHETTEQLQQLVQCLGDEVEALREDNKESCNQT